MKEITDAELAEIRAASCSVLVQKLVARLDRVEKEAQSEVATLEGMVKKALADFQELRDSSRICELCENASVKAADKMLQENTALRERVKRMEGALQVIARQTVAEQSIAGMMVRDAQAALKEGE